MNTIRLRIQFYVADSLIVILDSSIEPTRNGELDFLHDRSVLASQPFDFDATTVSRVRDFGRSADSLSIRT
jgi:hypothetical protein